MGRADVTGPSRIELSTTFDLVVKVDAPVLFTQSIKLANGSTVYKDTIGYVEHCTLLKVPCTLWANTIYADFSSRVSVYNIYIY